MAGHLLWDLEGVALTPLERELLQHPQSAGLILFSRNFESKRQLTQLIRSIRQCAPDALVTVDQEGGRVQRFRQGFTPLPPLAEYGRLFETAPDQALEQAEKGGFILASELLAVQVDVSFAPVLDRDWGYNDVIGNRSFHATSVGVVALGRAFIRGMHLAGMPAVGKHFPGHGAVAGDSHHGLPVDDRPYALLYQEDMQPFIELTSLLQGMMPAHIVYPAVDTFPAGFSRIWLEDILRKQLGFTGVIVSDDLSMGGAAGMGSYVDRANAALGAGCDLILVCNNRSEVIRLFDALGNDTCPVSSTRIPHLRKHLTLRAMA